MICDVESEKKKSEELLNKCMNHLEYWGDHFSTIYKIFEKDELISEAWVRGISQIKNPKYLSNRIKFNMIDYIRYSTKNRNKNRVVEKTNFFNHEKDGSFAFEKPFNDKKTEEIDNKDLLKFLLLNVEIKERSREIIRLYYLEGKSYSKISSMLNISESHVSLTLKKAREELKNFINKMDIKIK